MHILYIIIKSWHAFLGKFVNNNGCWYMINKWLPNNYFYLLLFCICKAYWKAYIMEEKGSEMKWILLSSFSSLFAIEY